MVATSWIVTLSLGIWSGSGMGIEPVLAASPGIAWAQEESTGYAFAAQIAAMAAEPSREEAAYNAGRTAIDAGRFAEAVETFRKLAAEGGEDADRALFWQAYSEAKASRTAAALGTLQRLKGEHPESPWLDDAKALEVELRGAGGTSVAASEDEELKLYVLDGLLASDSERAVPLLLKFLAGNHSDRLKERALFVLSQSDSPEAFSALLKIARGADQPRLQLEAVRVLGVSGEETAVKALEEVYRTSSNREVKAEALRGFLVADAPAPLLRVAKEEKDAELRAEAIRQLGAMEAGAELGQLYAVETSRELKAEILRSMGVAGEVEALARAARQESDPELKAEAIRGLGITESDESAAVLTELYRQSSNLEVKKAALEALFIQSNSKALLAIFKSESDRELKRQALQYLSMVDDEASDELIDSILNDEN